MTDSPAVSDAARSTGAAEAALPETNPVRYALGMFGFSFVRAGGGGNLRGTHRDGAQESIPYLCQQLMYEAPYSRRSESDWAVPFCVITILKSKLLSVTGLNVPPHSHFGPLDALGLAAFIFSFFMVFLYRFMI